MSTLVSRTHSFTISRCPVAVCLKCCYCVCLRCCCVCECSSGERSREKRSTQTYRKRCEMVWPCCSNTCFSHVAFLKVVDFVSYVDDWNSQAREYLSKDLKKILRYATHFFRFTLLVEQRKKIVSLLPSPLSKHIQREDKHYPSITTSVSSHLFIVHFWNRDREISYWIPIDRSVEITKGQSDDVSYSKSVFEIWTRFRHSQVIDLWFHLPWSKMNLLKRGNSILSRRVVPLQTSHLLEIDATVKTKSQLSTDTLKYLCEQGAVRSLSISISHIHTHRYTTQT